MLLTKILFLFKTD